MPFQLTITLNEQGQIGVNGPIDNRLLCYGLLDMAREAIYNHGKQSENRIQPVPPGLVLPRLS